MTHDATNLAHLAQQAQHFFRVPGGDIVEGFPPRRPLGHCSREEKKKKGKKTVARARSPPGGICIGCFCGRAQPSDKRPPYRSSPHPPGSHHPRES